MAISACEICGKPFNDALGKICGPCSKSVDETYIKVRKFMYQNPKNTDFISVVEGTEVSEKELNWLIKKGRIEVSNRPGGGAKCRACGKETAGGSLCESCMTKLFVEKMNAKEESKPSIQDKDKKGIIPKSFIG